MDINEPFGKLAYIIECAKNDIIPKYEIVDNPFSNVKREEKENNLERSKLDVINYAEKKNSSVCKESTYIFDKKNSLRKTNMILIRNLKKCKKFYLIFIFY